jgi:hypothetical protein
MTEDYLDYGKLIDDAMHHVVRSALHIVDKTGLTHDHHFFITFNTRHPGVMIADELLEKYPEEMTIVMQHQYWDLTIEEERFSIVLSFDNIKQNLTVPFASLVSFADPSVKFGLQFADEFIDRDDETLELPHPKGEDKGETKDDGMKGANVVTLDSFRKK